MTNMADGASAALRIKMRDDDRAETFMCMARADRKRLVSDYINEQKNEARLRDYLADLAAEDGEFLHALQRGNVKRMQKLFSDAIDFRVGDELVDQEAHRLEEI